MSVFFDLPEDHQRIILGQWLEVKDVGTLDCATCNHSLRSNYLAILAASSTVLQLWTSGHDPAADKWVVQRHIRFQKIILAGTQDPCLRNAVVELSAHTVKSLIIYTEEALTQPHFYREVEPSVYDTDTCLSGVLDVIAGCCAQLTEFVVYSGNSHYNSFRLTSWDSLIALIQANPLLRSLSLERGKNIGRAAMEAICAAPSLAVLNLQNCTFAELLSVLPTHRVSPSVTYLKHCYRESLLELCKHFPNLTKLSGELEGDDLVRVCTFCPHLTHVSLKFTGRICSAAASSVSQLWPNLTHLTLQSLPERGIVCNEEAVLQLVTALPTLQYLNTCEHQADLIPNPRNWDNEYWLPEQKHEEKIRFKNLRSDLTGTNSHLQMLRVDRLSEQSLLAILSHCTNLHTLGIHHNGIKYTVPNNYVAAERTLHHLTNSSVKSLYLNDPRLSNADIIRLSGL